MPEAQKPKSKTTKPKRTPKPSVEEIKIASRYLSEGVREQLENENANVDETGYQLLKFSGIYQQDNRDLRPQLRKQGKDRDYSFMVRSKAPAGILSAEQYLVHDRLCDSHGDGTMRFTTRQGIQLHGVVKGDLKPLIQELNQALVTTLAACGDVNRNVMGCPAPQKDREHALIDQVCRELEAHLLPRSAAYYDLWIDGEKQQVPVPPAVSNKATADEQEPIYGKTYLPRKFKIGVAFPHDNCVDVFTQDIGIVPVLEGETLRGYDLLVGGGMGMSHTDDTTFPRLAEPLGFVAPDALIATVEAIVTVQRDFGNRENRKRARMKYLVDEWGIEKFRATVQERLEHEIQPWVDVGEFSVDDHLGWREQGDGRYYFGVPVENGRIKDAGEMRLRSGLRAILEHFRCEVRITAQHNLLLVDLKEEDEEPLRAMLREYGIRTKEEITKARRYSIACPALPTCGLALAESERVMPRVIDDLEGELESLGLGSEDIVIRMTGCPNGCARPHTAELAFIGRSPGKYKLYVGGAFNGARLAQEYADLVDQDHLLGTVAPLFKLWKEQRQPDEHFGDFCYRQGVEALQEQTTQLQEVRGHD